MRRVALSYRSVCNDFLNLLYSQLTLCISLSFSDDSIFDVEYVNDNPKLPTVALFS